MFKALAKPFFLKLLQYHACGNLWSQRKQHRHGLPFELVVSLTSYPARFPTLFPTLASLLSQDILADKIVLWIAHSDLPGLPANVKRLERHGLDIRATADLRSYKKIIPSLAAFPDAAIITADDDVYYPRKWLRYIVEAYSPDVREVLCHRAHRMERAPGGLAPYRTWQFEISDNNSTSNLFATGVGGVFYPPGIFHPDVVNVDRLMALCPTTDDVWLNWMARLTGAAVRKVGPKQRFYEWPGSQLTALLNQNYLEGSSNDEQLARIIEVYGVPEAIR